MAESQALLTRGVAVIQENDSGPTETSDWSLTWGFEFEFLLAYSPPTDIDAQLNAICNVSGMHSSNRLAEAWRLRNRLKERIRGTVVERLRHAKLRMNVNAMNMSSRGGYDTSSWTVDRDGSVQPTDAELTARKHLLLNGQVLDAAIHGKIEYLDVEVMSPVLRADADSIHQSLEEVKKVLDAIRTLPVRLNKSCGFHVHIGNRDRGYGVDTVKNLMTLMTMAQYQFNEAHPLHRLFSEYCILPDRAFEPIDRNPQQMTCLVEDCPSLEDVVFLFTTERHDRSIHNHSWAVNLVNLTGRPDRRTVEWRQHAGTLDFGEVGRWVLLLSILLCKSNSINNPFYGIDQYVANHDYGLNDLLQDMDLEPCRQDYEGRLHLHDRNKKLPDPFAPENIIGSSSED